MAGRSVGVDPRGQHRRRRRRLLRPRRWQPVRRAAGVRTAQPVPADDGRRRLRLSPAGRSGRVPRRVGTGGQPGHPGHRTGLPARAGDPARGHGGAAHRCRPAVADDAGRAEQRARLVRPARLGSERVVVVGTDRCRAVHQPVRADGDLGRRGPAATPGRAAGGLSARGKRPSAALVGRAAGRSGRCGQPGRRAVDRLLRKGIGRQGRCRGGSAHPAADHRNADPGTRVLGRTRGRPVRSLGRR